MEVPDVGKVPQKINPRINLMGLGDRYDFEKKFAANTPGPSAYKNIDLHSIKNK